MSKTMIARAWMILVGLAALGSLGYGLVPVTAPAFRNFMAGCAAIVCLVGGTIWACYVIVRAEYDEIVAEASRQHRANMEACRADRPGGSCPLPTRADQAE